jgi:ATP diphosphatase
LKVDPEIALKRSNAKFTSRFQEMERLARASGRVLANAPRSEMELLWERAKAAEVAKSLAMGARKPAVRP